MSAAFPPDLGIDVSRETVERLSIYVDTLKRWNSKINLVSRTTMDDVWRRHILDSAQLAHLAPNAEDWLDLGAGAGLPGLIVAATKADRNPAFTMTVVESDQRKCAFMAEASRRMGVSVEILNTRIEQTPDRCFDVVSARALAPLSKLLAFAYPHRNPGAICLFPKGAQVDQELTDAAKTWHMTYDRVPSVVDETSVILNVKEFQRVA